VVEIESGVFSEAVREFWQTRQRQVTSQRARGITDQGARGAVTGGRQMAGFARRISQIMQTAGVQESDIYVRGRRELPGFFRATKDWDLVVVTHGELLAVVELKAQVGPSFGNNFNNRTEEALGSSLDLWTAYREKAFAASPQPWLGYLFLLEDCPESRAPVKVREPHFPVFPEFRDASYAKRYELFCRKLVLERQYSAACFLLADKKRARSRQNYAEPAADLSGARFLSGLLRHVARV
jgi:hypothetical protein